MLDNMDEALVILAEECGELTQAAMKIIRFGASDREIERLEQEAGDVMCLLEYLHSYDMISWTNIDDASERKREKLKIYSDLYRYEDVENDSGI
jgi:NTP pyrophosphatase (non-canonical NTP hydrolase)